MDLDELKEVWRERDSKLDARLRLDARTARGVTDARLSLTGVRFGLWAEIVIGSALLLAVGDFGAGHVGESASLLASLGVGAWLLGVLVAAARTLTLLHDLDWGTAVVALQRRLEMARITRARSAQLLLGGGVVLWAPAAMIALEASGVRAFSLFSGAWLLANVLVGAIVLTLAVVSARRIGDRLDGDSLPERIGRVLAGNGITRALAFLRATEGEEAYA